MAQSAIETDDARARRRAAMSHRITVHAQRLVDTHGLDGFTMEDLAQAADVSRRTVFNYFDSKLDAILGRIPEVPEALLDTFRAGGPTGDLIDDLAVIVEAVLGDHDLTREEAALGQRVLREPRLLAASHERLASYAEPFVALMAEREGRAHDERRARLTVSLFVWLADLALEAYSTDAATDADDRSLAAIYLDLLATTRLLMAPAAR